MRGLRKRTNFNQSLNQSVLGQMSMGWVFGLALVFSLLAVIALRQNNLTMLEKRQAVIDADATMKSKAEINDLLLDLRNFTSRHMNTQMSSYLQLINTYAQDNQDQQRKAFESSVNQTLYQEAEDQCQFANSVQRATCINDYINKNTTGEPFKPPKDLPIEKYQFIFTAPAWSPDIAGFSLLAAGAMWIWLLLKKIRLEIIRRRLRPQ